MNKKSHARAADKQGFSIALPIDLIKEIQEIANKKDRSRNRQIEHFLKAAIEAYKLRSCGTAQSS